MNNLKKVNELKAGTILSYINIVISSVIPLLYTPIMLRILGQAEYGVYTLANSVISYLTLLNFGMGTAVVRYVTKYRAEENKDAVEKITGLFLMVYLFFAVLVCVAGAILSFRADLFFSNGLSETEVIRLKILMLIMTVSTAVSFPVSVFSSVSIAYEKYIFKRLFEMITTILAPVLNLLILFAGKGTIGIAWIGLLMQVVSIPIYMFYCSRKLQIKIQMKNLPFYMLREIGVFSAFIFMSSIVDMLYWATDKVLIGAMLGSVAVAIYNVGGVFTSMLQQMSSAISSVFTTRITTMVVKDTPIKEISSMLIRIGRIQYLIISFILSGYIVFGQRFIYFWAGNDYQSAYYIGLVTMIPLSVPLIQNIAFSTIVAQNKHQFRSIVYACIAVVNLVSTYMVIPYFGIIGAAVCTGAAFVLGNGIIMNLYYYKVTRLDIPLFWKNILRMTVVPGGMAAVGYVVINKTITSMSLIGFLTAICIYSVLFWTATWLFTMNNYEHSLFFDLFRKLFRLKE